MSGVVRLACVAALHLHCWLVLQAGGSEAAAAAPALRLRDGRYMPGLALGTWPGNDTRGSAEQVAARAERAVRWALGAGYRHVDTAAHYGVERPVGRALASSPAPRDALYVTTKLWNDAHARGAVLPALRDSLARLGLAHVDLYLMHWPLAQHANGSYELTDYLETWRGMLEVRALGLARSVGVSNFNRSMLQRVLDSGLEPPAVLQVEVNLNLQQPALLAYCRDHNITVMGYTPFGSLFPGKARPDAPPPRVDEPALVALAGKYNKTVPQVALRYLVELGVVPIPKSTTKRRIEQNLDVFDFELNAAERDLLRAYDANYRTIPQLKWRDHPYYPFEITSPPL